MQTFSHFVDQLDTFDSVRVFTGLVVADTPERLAQLALGDE